MSETDNPDTRAFEMTSRFLRQTTEDDGPAAILTGAGMTIGFMLKYSDMPAAVKRKVLDNVTKMIWAMQDEREEFE